MVDVVSIVVAIPDAVEAFVKTCRALQAYRNVENTQKQAMVDAIHYSRKLNYYAHFVDIPQQTGKELNGPGMNDGTAGNSKNSVSRFRYDDPDGILEDSQDFLCDLFNNSLLALDSAQKVVDEWTLRLRIDSKERNRSRRFLAGIALSLSYRLIGEDRKRSPISELYGKAAFMIIGCQQIEDAMGRLKHWLRELHDVLVVSPVLHMRLSKDQRKLVEDNDDSPDDVLFVAMARERERGDRNMETIKPELISQLRPLDNRKAQSFMLVEGKNNPYSDCLVDRRDVMHLIGADKEEQALSDTERIAKLFAEEKDELGHEISASVGILPCCGFVRPAREYHDLVFRLPPGTRRPRTLRSLLLDGQPQHSLNFRLDVCIKLATAVLIVHSLNLVHKDISPDSIIVIEPIFQVPGKARTSQGLGEPYLVGFNESRSSSSYTVPAWKEKTEERRWKTLYCHPRHLATVEHHRFEMRDDIYSLGLCLLEVALWHSLFVWDDEQEIYVLDLSVCDLSEERYDRMLEEMGEDTNRSQAWFRQIDLVRLAEEKIPITMGEAFKDVVVECLTFGMGKQSLAEILRKTEPGSVHMKNQSVTFIRNVLSKLRDLKLS